MKILSENETMYISPEEQATELFDRIDSSSVWARVYTKELKAVGLDKAPLLIPELRSTNRFDSSVSDDSIIEAMESVNLAVKVPIDTGYFTYPLATTGVTSLLQRSGYGIDSSALKRTKDSNGKNAMEPSKKAKAINFGLEIAEDKSLVYILDEKIRAVHSGDECDYARLPFSELMQAFKAGLKDQFAEIFFTGASADHLYLSCTYVIKDEEINTRIKNVFEMSGIDVSQMFTTARLISSDTGNAGANIYPYLQSATRMLAVGKPISLTHKNGHTIEDFKHNVEQVVSMFKDSEEKLEQMGNTSVKHPAGMIQRIAKQCGLSKKLSVEAAVTFEGMFGAIATQLDVWWEINDIYENGNKSDKLSESRKISIQESIARICFSDMSEYDIPFNWE